MKVNELIELLKEEDQEAIVVLSGDPEGNYFQPLLDVDGNNRYDEESRVIKLISLTDELKDAGFNERDVAPESWSKAVVLWP